MKKLTLICSTVLLGFGLAGCGNQNHRLDIHSKVKSEKVSSKKKVLILQSQVVQA